MAMAKKTIDYCTTFTLPLGQFIDMYLLKRGFEPQRETVLCSYSTTMEILIALSL
jgi:hypothetical protein